jgi:hypothetical protein
MKDEDERDEENEKGRKDTNGAVGKLLEEGNSLLAVDGDDTGVDVRSEVDALAGVKSKDVRRKERRDVDVLHRLVFPLLSDSDGSQALAHDKVGVAIRRIVSSVGVVELLIQVGDILMEIKVVGVRSLSNPLEASEKVDLHGEVGVWRLSGDIEEGVELSSRRKRLESRLSHCLVERNGPETVQNVSQRRPLRRGELAQS